MRYIDQLSDGQHISEIYLCKSKSVAVTKNGKEYGNVVFQDRTGLIDGKIWDLNSPGVRQFEPMDYVCVDAAVTLFNGARQLNVRSIRKAAEGSYNPADYFPVSPYSIDAMQKQLLGLINSVENKYLRELLENFFHDGGFMDLFSAHSAAKSVHHGFIGGLLQHTLSVAMLCERAARHYGSYINRDLLITGAILHDIGKTRELSDFPLNEYTDEGQLLGHIMIGAGMVSEAASKIEGFPERLKAELLHLILSHHGELEYGSPKKPALIEALILSFIDNMDAKVETMHEAIENKQPVNEAGWLGYNKFLDTNIRKTCCDG